MANYSYVARNEAGKLIRAVISAEDERDLANKIGNLGYFLISFKKTAGTKVPSRGVARLKPKEVLDFTVDLSTMLNAAVPLVDSLRDLSSDTTNKRLSKVIVDIRQRVESGSSLKGALSYCPASFSAMYLSIVGAGESTGKLPSCLDSLAGFLEWQLELRAKVREAASYPLILFTVMIGVVSLIVIKVIPTFEGIFKDVGVQLPLLTQIILGFSKFVRGFWYIILGGIFLLVAAYKIYSSTAAGKPVVDKAKIKLPIFGNLLYKVALSRFCHTFALVLRSGIHVLSALDLSGEVIGNAYLEAAVKKARELVNVGERIAVSFQASGCFPPLVIRMIAVGEHTGTLPQSLERVNHFYDREVPATIRKMFAVFEPVMIVTMGVVIGGIALAIFLPMFQMAELVGK